MRQKLRIAAAVAAIVAALAGTALAVATHWDVLDAYFQGDTSPAQDLVDREVRTISDENYTLTVESSVCDESSAFLLVRIDALTQEAQEFMASDDFNGIDTWNVRPLAPEVGEDGTVTLEYHGGSTSYSEVKERRTDSSTTWRLNVSLTGADYTHMHVRMGYMEKGLFLEFPLTPAETVEVEIGATGDGSAWYQTQAKGQVTLDSVSISPLTLQMNVTWQTDSGRRTNEAALPPILFRMADGSLRTMPRILHQINTFSYFDSEDGSDTSPFQGCWPIRFESVQDLSQIAGIVVWGREYPLDGGPSVPVEVDGHLLPFEIPLGPTPGAGNVGYTVPVRALCDGLGAACVWDSGTQTATMDYQGTTIALTWGSSVAVVNGQEVVLRAPVMVQDGYGRLYSSPDAAGAQRVEDGVLYVEVAPFEEAWQLWFNCTYDSNQDQPEDQIWTVYP